MLERFRFLDGVRRLPEAAEDRLWAELPQYEEQQVMRYVTSVERIGIKKGLQQGLQQSEIQSLRRPLTQRFGELPAWAEPRLREAPPEQLKAWAEHPLEANRLEKVFDQSNTER